MCSGSPRTAYPVPTDSPLRKRRNLPVTHG